eukprot:2466146-Pleurochrysis_carterae.AAC.2
MAHAQKTDPRACSVTRDCACERGGRGVRALMKLHISAEPLGEILDHDACGQARLDGWVKEVGQDRTAGGWQQAKAAAFWEALVG